MRCREIGELVANTLDPSYAVDGSGHIAAWNSAAEALFALSACDAIGRPCHEVLQGADECGPVCSAECPVLQAARAHYPVGNFDVQLNTAKGPLWCNVSVLIADVENAYNAYALHIVREIDFHKRFELLMREFVLTGTELPAEQVTTLMLSPRSPSRNIAISVREYEILKLLANGISTIAIAEQLNLSRNTVNNHIQRILRKLGAHSRIEAVRRAEHSGLI